MSLLKELMSFFLEVSVLREGFIPERIENLSLFFRKEGGVSIYLGLATRMPACFLNLWRYS